MITLPTPHTRPLSPMCRRLDTAWSDGRSHDPYLNLLAHIVIRAWRDCMSGSPGQADDARRYLSGPNFRNDCEWLGIDPTLILNQLDAMARKTLPDEQVRELHARYLNENLSLKATAAAANVSPMTLSRAFGRLGLPARKPGTTAALLRARQADTSLDELQRLIAALEKREGKVVVRIEIESKP